jgi:hypothetical protein
MMRTIFGRCDGSASLSERQATVKSMGRRRVLMCTC